MHAYVCVIIYKKKEYIYIYIYIYIYMYIDKARYFLLIYDESFSSTFLEVHRLALRSLRDLSI